jgi:ABC-2 type transport system ATP-binding protein
MLVAAFAVRTALLVLDEPTSGLDPLMEDVFQSCVRDAAAQGRTVLLSSHILTEVEELCEAVTIIKDGALVESGKLAGMRHLAASQITARLPEGCAAGVAVRLRDLGVVNGVNQGTDLAISVSRDRVTAVLGVPADVQAGDITCTPTSLEDLFLRHYQAAIR